MEGKNQQKTKLLPNSWKREGKGYEIGNKNYMYVKFEWMDVMK